jgi:hypothetical protein
MAARVPPQLEALIALAAVLAPRAKKLPTELTTAFRDPEGYIASHAKNMKARGILEPMPKLSWMALIDGLEAASALVEVDWRSDNEELESAIRRLVKRFRVPADDTGDRSTAEMLELSGIELRKQGLQLAHLDFGSDSYALFAVPTAQFAEVARLAKRARFGEAKAFGDTLEETRRARLAAQAKANARQVAVRPRAPVVYEWTRYTKGDETWFILRAKGGNRFHTRYAGPTGPRAMDYFFNKSEKAAAAASRQLAAWKKDGFRFAAEGAAPKVVPRGYRRSAYSMLVVEEYPEDGRYFVSEKETVCVLVRGDAVCVLTDFLGPRERCSEHYGAGRLTAVVARLAQSYREIGRDALMAARSKTRTRRGARG